MEYAGKGGGGGGRVMQPLRLRFKQGKRFKRGHQALLESDANSLAEHGVHGAFTKIENCDLMCR